MAYSLDDRAMVHDSDGSRLAKLDAIALALERLRSTLKTEGSSLSRVRGMTKGSSENNLAK